MVNKRDKIINKLIKKDYNNELEEVLSKKMFREDVKNLLLNILYKVEISYKDYMQVKRNVLSKEVYINNIIKIIQNYCDSVILVKPKQIEDINTINCTVDKDKKAIKCYPIERILLHSLYELKKSEDIIKVEIELLNKTLTNTINIGNNINAVEPLRDFNGFSWNICVNEIDNLYYNLIYQDLIFLVGNEFLDEWSNKNDCVIDYMELFKSELKNKYGRKIANNILELLNKLSVLLEININNDLKDEMKDNKDIVQEELKRISNKEEYLEKLCIKKKSLIKRIRDIDIYVNNKELLQNEYKRINKKLPLEEKIFSARILAKKMEEERIQILNQVEEYNELMNPNNFRARKQILEEQYKYLMLVDIEDLENTIIENILLLQKEIFRVFKIKIEKAMDKNSLLNLMYEIRYFLLLPLSKEVNIYQAKGLVRMRNSVIESLINKSNELNLMNEIFFDKKKNMEILKIIFSSKIIELEDIYFKIEKENDEFYIKIFNENVEELRFKIDLDIQKEDFKIKINKRTKLFV